MELKEMIFWLKTMSEEVKATPDCLENNLRIEAIDIAITALKKRPSYLRLINRYQKKQKNQSEELKRLNSYRTPMKPEWICAFNDDFGVYRCGRCSEPLANFTYCPNCGQAILWENFEEVTP